MISVGMPLDAVAEASLLHKTIACGISDGGLDWTWTEEWSMPAGLQPAPRQAAMRAIRNADRVTEQQLDEFFRYKHSEREPRNRQWADAVDKAIIRFICEDMFASIKPSDDWYIMFSRAYLHAFVREWKATIGSLDGVKGFQKVGHYVSSHLYAAEYFTSLRRTLKKAGRKEDPDRLIEFWESRINEYDHWLGFAIDDGREPDWYGAAQIGDIETFWRSVNETRRMPDLRHRQ